MNETLGWPEFNWVPPIPDGYPEDIGKAEQSSKSTDLRYRLKYLRNVLKSHLTMIFPICTDKNTDELDAKQFLEEYNSTAETVWNAYTEASWKYNTDINEANNEELVMKHFRGFTGSHNCLINDYLKFVYCCIL